MKSLEELECMIAEYESFIRKIGTDESEADIVLYLRDDIEDRLTEAGESLRDRLTQLDEMLKSKSGELLAELDDPEELRKVLQPSRDRWWWYLDKVR